MTYSPVTPGAAQDDVLMPQVCVSVRLPICWLRTLKTKACTRPDQSVSSLVKEALLLWADENEIDLNGFNV